MRSLGFAGILAAVATIWGHQAPAFAKDLHQSISDDGRLEAFASPNGRATFAPNYAGTGRRSKATIANAAEMAAIRAARPAELEGYPEAVIGPDGRTKITNTTTYPARATALVTFQETSGGGTFICTGWFISVDTVATAGHCVHSGQSGTPFFVRTSYRIYPGRNGAVLPYGSCRARRLYSVTGWTSGSGENYDYAAIKLDCTTGNTVGWYGFYWTSSSLTGTTTTVQGYPGDKGGTTQWTHSDRVRVTQTRRVFYQNDTAGGESGSAVWTNRSSTCNPCSLAIHTTGNEQIGGVRYNGGTRIIQAVFNNLVNWKNAP
jgi:glutamyl endopeptidase